MTWDNKELGCLLTLILSPILIPVNFLIRKGLIGRSKETFVDPIIEKERTF
jgi:hypothetical protein